MMLMIPLGYETASPDVELDPERMKAMMKYNEALKDAGVLITLDGLHPPSMGARVSFASGKPVVTDGPFTEAKEVLGGFFLLAQFGSQRFAKILGRKYLADLDLVAGAERRALHPGDCFVQRPGLDQPETGDQVAAQRERTICRSALRARIFDPRALRGWVQALARLHDTGFHHLLVELAHRGQQFRGGHDAGFGIPARLYNHHKSHRHAPFAVSSGRILPDLVNWTNGVLPRRHPG